MEIETEREDRQRYEKERESKRKRKENGRLFCDIVWLLRCFGMPIFHGSKHAPSSQDGQTSPGSLHQLYKVTHPLLLHPKKQISSTINSGT
jgi:hypothetical protein